MCSIMLNKLFASPWTHLKLHSNNLLTTSESFLNSLSAHSVRHDKELCQQHYSSLPSAFNNWKKIHLLFLSNNFKFLFSLQRGVILQSVKTNYLSQPMWWQALNPALSQEITYTESTHTHQPCDTSLLNNHCLLWYPVQIFFSREKRCGRVAASCIPGSALQQ